MPMKRGKNGPRKLSQEELKAPEKHVASDAERRVLEDREARQRRRPIRVSLFRRSITGEWDDHTGIDTDASDREYRRSLELELKPIFRGADVSVYARNGEDMIEYDDDNTAYRRDGGDDFAEIDYAESILANDSDHWVVKEK